jgi:hypothetical protein
MAQHRERLARITPQGFILRPEIARMVSERELKNRALAYSLCCIESKDPRGMVEPALKRDHRQRCRFAKRGTMEPQRIEELRAELDLLLTNQTQVLELRILAEQVTPISWNTRSGKK